MDRYQDFYTLASNSVAHSRFCERVYGADLCQDGQSDMRLIDDMIERMQLKPGDCVLDLGCGAGGLSQYLSDRTGACVTGIDRSASAIEVAQSRAGSRLTFVQANMNSLDLAPASFDAAVFIDSIMWAESAAEVVSSVARAIKGSGQICIVTEHRVRKEDPAGSSSAQEAPVGAALSALRLKFDAVDLTSALLPFWTRARKAAQSLREEFLKEDAGFIYDTWIKFADEIYLPAINANRIRRYLYHAHLER